MAENGWVTDALVEFADSPLWKTPVENFIDDNCCIFSTDSEMKLEYTVVHHKFRDLIDSLLTNCVEELGVPMETAVEALRSSLHEHSHEYHARTQHHAAKKMLTQVFSADNFSSFYTMMVKRNLELDILAAASLRAHGVNLEVSKPLTSAELHEEGGARPARTQRALDANGDVAEDEALRLAIAASLQDPQSQAQVRAYDEVCALEDVNLRVEDAEREAQQQRMQLEEALRDRDRTPEVEQYRKERLELIDQQKNSQISQIQNYTLSGPKQSFYHDSRRPIAEFSCPEIPEMPLPTSPPELANQAPDVVPAVVTPAVVSPPSQPQTQQPSAAPDKAAAAAPQPPMGHQQGALPSIAHKPAAATPSSTAAAPSATTAANGAATHAPSAAAGPSKEELEKRAQYMREQREMILARNRASRQQQLSSYVEHAQQPSAGQQGSLAGATGAQKDLMVEIAQRLRGDLVGEARKSSS